MKPVNIPHRLSVQWIREAYKNNKLTPEELIQEIITRSKEDSDMNIWITPPSMDFIKPYLDRLKNINQSSLLLWGIPFSVKDNIDLAGIPTTAGCPDFSYTPDHHAVCVERLIAAGAVPVGKTNLDQFATGLVGTRSPYGETQNAIRKELISGGSSSGSAVAVAMGHAAFSLGTDTAGSGRVPAALNNIIGFKPSLGAWPTKGVVPACASLDCVTVFTIDLNEAVEVDSVIRGSEKSDPWSKSMAVPEIKVPAKICLPEKELNFFGPFAEKYNQAWYNVIERIEKLNIPVQYINMDVFQAASELLYDGPFVAERWADLGRFVERNPGTVFPVTKEILRTGAKAEYDAASVFNACHKLQALKLETRKILENGVLILPTAGGTWTRLQVREDPIRTNSMMGRYTNHCNLLDLCAVAVPAGEAMKDTPFGISIFGLAENEGLALGAAEIFGNKKAVSTYKEKERKNTTLVAVCGLHMRGFFLEKQMVESGARFLREASTAEKYQLVRLPTIPAKPGLIKKQTGGNSIIIEIWEMPLENFGRFTAAIPSPLGIGKIELEDGEEIPGFICEGYAESIGEDITSTGGWKNYIHLQ